MAAKIPNPAEADRLDSWKEIAAHIGRDVRTAIRWEHERGLPVHRLPGGRRGVVFAYRDEVDRWLLSAAEAGGPVPPTRPTWRRAVVLPSLAATALVLTLAFAALWASHQPSPGAPAGPRIDRLELEARAVVARAEDGSVAWRHELGDRTVPQSRANTPWFAIADVDGDGRAEVAASVPLDANGDGYLDELYLFSGTGKVLWRQRLQDRLTFRAGTFGPPWATGHVAIYRVRGEARIAWGIGHHTWWPGILAVLDGSGRRLGTFVHGGQIRAVRAVETARGPLLLVGGISNAYRAAFMAVLDGSAVTGQGPVPFGSPFECAGCDKGRPLHYFVFPPSDISRASGAPYNFTRDLLPHGEQIEAYTRESDPGAPMAEMIFRFSRDFHLLDARTADSWAAHEAFEKAGKLDHGVAECPWYRDPPPVREWTPTGGWIDVRPNSAVPLVPVASAR